MSVAVKKYNLTFSLLYLASLILFILIAKGELVLVGTILVFFNLMGFPSLFCFFVKEELSDVELTLLTKYYGKWSAIATLLIFLLGANQFKIYLSDTQLFAYFLVIFIAVPLFGYMSRYMFYLNLMKLKDYRSTIKKNEEK